MGRKRIQIEKISNERTRQVTFYKRKRGLLKKAMEIALLCEVKVMLCIVDKNEKCVLYSSEDPEGIIKKHILKKFETKSYLKNHDYKNYTKEGRAERNDGRYGTSSIVSPMPCTETPLCGNDSFPLSQPKKKSIFLTHQTSEGMNYMKSRDPNDALMKSNSKQQAKPKGDFFGTHGDSSVALSGPFTNLEKLSSSTNGISFNQKKQDQKFSVIKTEPSEESKHKIVRETDLGVMSSPVESKRKDMAKMEQKEFGGSFFNQDTTKVQEEANREVMNQMPIEAEQQGKACFQQISNEFQGMLMDFLQYAQTPGFSSSSSLPTRTATPQIFSNQVAQMKLNSPSLNPYTQLNQYTYNQLKTIQAYSSLGACAVPMNSDYNLQTAARPSDDSKQWNFFPFHNTGVFVNLNPSQMMQNINNPLTITHSVNDFPAFRSSLDHISLLNVYDEKMKDNCYERNGN